MKFAIYESIKMNATTKTYLSVPKKESIQDYHVHQVIPGVPEGTTREEAIQQLSVAGYYLQDGLEISAEPEWPEKVRSQVNPPYLDLKSRRSWADFRQMGGTEYIVTITNPLRESD